MPPHKADPPPPRIKIALDRIDVLAERKQLHLLSPEEHLLQLDRLITSTKALKRKIHAARTPSLDRG
ncbi:MAG TPA: hypothetical protein VME69_13150 [Methylocella sp.]|nr:hypothetical protein [Methylocella sp.]